MNKKRYLIIIIILIFLFLTIFSFANPFGNEEGEPNDNRVLEEIEEEDLINKEEQEETKPVDTPNYNNHGVNVTNKEEVEEDNSYELALEAVKKAEVTLDKDNYDKALELVNKVTDSDKKEELEERLEEVLNSINVKELVEKLVKMTKSSTNKVELDAARKFNTSNDIEDKISELTNEVLKETLEKVVDNIVYLLNDTTVPTINIEDGAILNKEVVVEVTDENEFTIILTTEGGSIKTINNGFKILNGTHTLKVVDAAFNEKVITFTVDTEEPIVNVIYSTEELTNGKVVATLVPSETVTVINNEGSFEYTFEENGTFTFEFIDKAGNLGTATATVENIDKEAKGVTFSNNGSSKKYYNIVATEVTVLEENVDKVSYLVTTTNDLSKAKKKFNAGEGKEVILEDSKFEVTLSNLNNNFYVYVKVVDKAGNVSYTRTTNKFKMDSTNPEGTITYSTEELTNGTVVVTLVPSETVTVINNEGSFEYTFEENGTFTFEFVDKAGNLGTATATVENIDITKPEISIGGTTGSKYWYQEQTFNTVITEENIDSVYYIWNQSNNENTMKRDLDSASATKVDVSSLVNNGDGTYTLSVTLNTEGRYVFNVKVVDKVGNVSYAKKGWYQIDRTKPSMQVGDTVYGPEHTEIIYSPTRFIATAIDGASGINKIYSNGHERERIDVNGDGAYTFTLVDKAGNTSIFKVFVDKKAPEITTKFSNGRTYIYGTDLTNIQFSVYKDEYNEDHLKHTFNTSTSLGGKSFSLSTGWFGNGKYFIEAIDDAGNKTVIETFVAENLNSALTYSDEITLYNDMDLGNDEPLVIPSGQNKVINLNGKKITGKSTKDTTSNLIQVQQGASLRLEGNGEISFLATKPDTDWVAGYPGYANNTIVNSGKLVIDGPTIKNNTSKGGASYVIDNYVGAELEIISGNIIQTGGDTAVRLFTSSATSSINVNVSGGTFSGAYGILIHLAANNPTVAPSVNLTISGGTFISTSSYKFALYSYSHGNSFANTNVTISGGTFNDNVVFGGGANTYKENVTITGGTFNGYVGRYLPDNGWEYIQ